MLKFWTILKFEDLEFFGQFETWKQLQVKSHYHNRDIESVRIQKAKWPTFLLPLK